MERAIRRVQSDADMHSSFLRNRARTGPRGATRFLLFCPQRYFTRVQVPPSRQMPSTQPFTANPLPESCILEL